MRLIYVSTFICLFFLLEKTQLSRAEFLTSKQIMHPDYGKGLPAKNEVRIDPITGVEIKRISKNTELSPSSHYGLIVYSRYTPVNTSAEYVVVHHDDSTSASLYRVSNGDNLGTIKRDAIHPIGEINEIRWDYSGNHPNHIYFVHGMGFYQMDVVNGNGRSTLIRDFSKDFPGADHVMNDVEGDSSNDSRYWAWQVLGPYAKGSFPRIAFIVYDKLKDTIVGKMIPADVGKVGELPKPNMVEISPLGTKVITHFGAASNHPCIIKGAWTNVGNNVWELKGYKAMTAGNNAFSVVTANSTVLTRAGESGSGIASDIKGDNQYSNNSSKDTFWIRLLGNATPSNMKIVANWGVRPDDAGSPLDAPHAWDLDFRHPVKISADETHSGWAFGVDGKEWFVSQNNKTDWIEARDIITGKAINILNHVALGWNNGFHFSKFYNKFQRGWFLMNTTAKSNTLWGENQILMVELKADIDNPIIWRVSPKYSFYDGDYREESPVALGYDGKTVWYTSNWGIISKSGDVYRTKFPDRWFEFLTNNLRSLQRTRGTINND